MTLPKPIPQSYTNHAGDFASGKDTPTAFLERCLANVEAFDAAPFAIGQAAQVD